MSWLGPMLRFIYAPAPDPQIVALLDVSRTAAMSARQSRERLERQAKLEPLDELAERR